jgi:hypothetical protein
MDNECLERMMIVAGIRGMECSVYNHAACCCSPLYAIEYFGLKYVGLTGLRRWYQPYGGDTSVGLMNDFLGMVLTWTDVNVALILVLHTQYATGTRFTTSAR